MPFARFCAAALLATVVFGTPVLVGCGNDPSTVSGKVTIDGAPLKNGAITFEPAAGDGPTDAGQIQDGAYSAQVWPGSKKVIITGYEVVGQVPAYGDPKGPMKNVTKSVVPPQYNTNTNLTAEIKDGANENVNFDLKSK